MTAVTPTDRPKSVRNSCVIKVFGGVFMLSRCFLDCSVGVEVFVTGLSQISSFFSWVESLDSDCIMSDEWRVSLHVAMLLNVRTRGLHTVWYYSYRDHKTFITFPTLSSPQKYKCQHWIFFTWILEIDSLNWKIMLLLCLIMTIVLLWNILEFHNFCC